MTFADYVGHYGLARSEGLRAALPDRRLQGASSRPCPRTPRPTSSTTSPSGWASWCARSTPACSTSGSACAHPETRRRRRTGGADRRRARRRSPPTAGPSGSWCATSCSAGSSWPPAAAGTRSASSTPTPAGPPSRWAEALDAYFAEHAAIGTGARRPRPGHALQVDEDRPTLAGPPDPRRPGRRPRLGHQPPRSTSPPPTRRARPSCGSSPSASSEPRRVHQSCGRLTGSWPMEQRHTLARTLLALPQTIEILPMRVLAFHIAELADQHRVSTLGAEAVAAAVHLQGPLCVGG